MAENIAVGKCGYKRVGDVVELTLASDDYDALLLRLGYAAGAAYQSGDKSLAHRTFALLNRLNLGNPNYAPYEVPSEFER